MEDISINRWVKEHKKQIIIGTGMVVGTAVLAYFGYKNKDIFMDSISDVLESQNDCWLLDSSRKTEGAVCLNTAKADAEDVVDMINQKITRCPHSVDGYLRHLPDGYNASVQKIQEALDNGFELPDGYTYVNSYCTGKRCSIM